MIFPTCTSCGKSFWKSERVSAQWRLRINCSGCTRDVDRILEAIPDLLEGAASRGLLRVEVMQLKDGRDSLLYLSHYAQPLSPQDLCGVAKEVFEACRNSRLFPTLEVRQGLQAGAKYDPTVFQQSHFVVAHF